MGGVLQSADVAALTQPADLDARIVYFPVRHHSPACAWHIDRLIREIRPAAVLIEGPHDATRLIPWLTHDKLRPPVAVFTTCVRRSGDTQTVERHAAYYPLCDYSPELAAVRAGVAIAADVQFIDLSYPQMIEAGRVGEQAGRADNLLGDRHLLHSRFLDAACARAHVRDPDELWDHLFEASGRSTPTNIFMGQVLAYCALARRSATPAELEADGTLTRERAMAARIAAYNTGRVVVVTGGYHTVALPTTQPKEAPHVDVDANDAVVVLMRYGFAQLDRLNGYASGMPAPAFYQHMWDGGDAAELLVRLGRHARQRGQPISVADEIAALQQCRSLAALRGHPHPAREEILDAVRSCYIKGEADTDGVMMLAMTRQMLAGDRVGDVPPDAGQPPIVHDFRATAQRLKIDLDRLDAREVTLDLYRNRRHRHVSRFFYRLRFLAVPFGDLVRGPDFAAGLNLERVQEVWKYTWTPDTESRLITCALYGAAVDEAAAALLLERFAEAQRDGSGRRSAAAASLLVEACRMGLHARAPELLAGSVSLIAGDSDFTSVVNAMTQFLLLHASREPLEAHDLPGLIDAAMQAHERACHLLPSLAATAENQEHPTLSALASLIESTESLGPSGAHRVLLGDRLTQLLNLAGGNPAVRGAAAGALLGDGSLPSARVCELLSAHLASLAGKGHEGPDFLRGLLHTARSALWQIEGLIDAVHQSLKQWDQDRFIASLPYLRLALADLTPRECDRLAHEVARHAGVEQLHRAHAHRLSTGDVAHAMRVEQRVLSALQRDGLTDLLEPPHA